MLYVNSFELNKNPVGQVSVTSQYKSGNTQGGAVTNTRFRCEGFQTPFLFPLDQWNLSQLSQNSPFACLIICYWARPGIESESSWVLVGLVSAVPHQEHLSPSSWIALQRSVSLHCCSWRSRPQHARYSCSIPTKVSRPGAHITFPCGVSQVRCHQDP